jgi:hypothetical protein
LALGALGDLADGVGDLADGAMIEYSTAFWAA